MTSQKIPDNFKDIVALVSFEDVAPMPVVGYTVTDNESGATLFYPKLIRAYIDWERILSWRYLADLWPDYMTEGADYDN